MTHVKKAILGLLLCVLGSLQAQKIRYGGSVGLTRHQYIFAYQPVDEAFEKKTEVNGTGLLMGGLLRMGLSPKWELKTALHGILITIGGVKSGIVQCPVLARYQAAPHLGVMGGLSANYLSYPYAREHVKAGVQLGVDYQLDDYINLNFSYDLAAGGSSALMGGFLTLEFVY